MTSSQLTYKSVILIYMNEQCIYLNCIDTLHTITYYICIILIFTIHLFYAYLCIYTILNKYYIYHILYFYISTLTFILIQYNQYNEYNSTMSIYITYTNTILLYTILLQAIYRPEAHLGELQQRGIMYIYTIYQ